MGTVTIRFAASNLLSFDPSNSIDPFNHYVKRLL
jgi:hypothetical protein